METVLTLATAVLPVLLAVAVAVRPARRPVGAILLVLAAGAAFHASTAEGERMATVKHAFQGFIDSEPGNVDYPVETITTSAGDWAWIVAGWSGLCGLALLAFGRRPEDPAAPRISGHPWIGPPLIGLGGVAVWLLLEKAAAPEPLVYPFPLERILVPATLAAGVLMAQRSDRFLTVFFQLVAFNYTMRGTIAYASYQLSTREMGTSLDVHGVREISNPVNQKFTELLSHSWEQHAWLIWAPHLIVMPALYMMSVGSLAFCAFMFLKHPAPPPAVPRG